MVRDFGPIKLVINTMDPSKMIKNREMEFINGRMEIFTKVSLWRILDMGPVICFGTMEVLIRDNGVEACPMEKGCIRLKGKSQSMEFFRTISLFSS